MFPAIKQWIKQLIILGKLVSPNKDYNLFKIFKETMPLIILLMLPLTSVVMTMFKCLLMVMMSLLEDMLSKWWIPPIKENNKHGLHIQTTKLTYLFMGYLNPTNQDSVMLMEIKELLEHL